MGEAGGRGDPTAQAARLRYELARLHDRRTVRAALAIGELRRGGAAGAWSALRGRSPRPDVPGPAVVPLRPPFPHLRAVHTGEGQLLASCAVHERVTPSTATVTIRRDRPDLVLVDGTVGWRPPELAALRASAHEHGAAVVTVGPSAALALPDADLRVATELPVPDADLELGVSVDVRRWSPAGLDDGGSTRRRGDAPGLTPEDARTQPIVVVRDVASVGVRRCLELLSAGAILLTAPDPVLAEELGPLAAEVVGSVDTLEERSLALSVDADRRRRLSVRLRRHVHRHLATRERLVTLVERLELDERPSERISVLLATRRPERLAQVTAELTAQRHPDVEVIVLPHGDAALPDQLPGVALVHRVDARRPLGAVLNAGLDLATGRYVAKVDDDDRYGTDHLGDQLLALHHSGAELVGKRVHGVYDETADVSTEPVPGGEERFEDHLPGGTLLAPADVMREVRWRHVPRAVDTELVRAVHLAGGSAYTTHRYGYVRVRHGDHLYEPAVDWTGSRVPGFDATLLEA